MNIALKRSAAERAYLAEIFGIDEDPSRALVLFLKQIDQLPGRTAVKIALGADMQVSVIFSECYLKMDAHVFPPMIFSPSLIVLLFQGGSAIFEPVSNSRCLGS